MKSSLTADRNSLTVKILSVICPLIYFASYLTRKNYSVIMADIIISEGISNADASLAATLSLISYGAGQIISGILGDKFKPQNIIVTGLCVTSLMNILMPISPNAAIRCIVWCINGFAQSMLWPPLVRIMAETLDGNTYNKVCVNVNVAAVGATILLYFTSSAIWIKYFNWKYVFYSSAVGCLIILAIWLIGFKKATKSMNLFENKKEDKKTKENTLTLKALLGSGFILIAIGIITQGALRDGVGDWVPSFIINTFSLESSSAILKSVVIPIFGVISLKLVGIVNQKLVKNEVKAAAVTFSMALVSCVLLMLLYKKNQYFILLLSALITGLMHGVNFFLICIVPSRFEKYNAVSTMSGVFNSLTYVGSAAATYGFGALSDVLGWNSVVIAWCVIALLGTVCCFISIKPWKKFSQL